MNREEFLSFVQSAPSVVVYTDGSCMGNPGPGGWGACFVLPDKKTFGLSGSEAHTTNNRMEMLGAIEALRITPEKCSIALYTDSQYLKNGITLWVPAWMKKGWKTSTGSPVKNQDLWQVLHEEAGKRTVIWQWVRAHNGDQHNEQADALAKQAAIAAHMRSSN